MHECLKVNTNGFMRTDYKLQSILILLLLWVMPAMVHAVPPTGSAEKDRLHIHFISASEEYMSEPSLKKFGQLLEERYENVRITSSWGKDAGSDLPDIAELENADLMLVFARRMTLPESQLHYILQHVELEKPVIGIRTASHAFQDFLELDEEVFGGDYDGHGDDEQVKVIMAEGMEQHSLLDGVASSWRRPDKIYHNPEPGPGTEILLFGEGLDSGYFEPLAWTNLYGERGRAFYTSMGLPEDFESENFIRLILNAIEWTSGQQLR